MFKGKRMFLFASIVMVFVGGSALAQQPAKPVVLTANVNFGQEALARPTTVASTGVGSAVLVLSADRTKVDYAVSVVGLTSPWSAAHFHSPGGFGTNAGVVKNICGPCTEGTLYTGIWSTTDMAQPLTQTFIDALLAGQIYFNAHTMMNGSGEVRGQVIPISPK